jgi:hypothetical protein
MSGIGWRGSFGAMPPLRLGSLDFHAPQRREADHEHKLATRRENQARRAVSEHQITTSGMGQRRLEDPIEFQVTFLEEPHFTSGFALASNPVPGLYLDPFANIGVRSWVTNDRGFYTGAWLYIRIAADLIDTASVPTTTPKFKVVCFMSFTGLAFKNPGEDGISESFATEVRTATI